MSDFIETLAHNLFKLQFPRRSWNEPFAKPPLVVERQEPPTTEAERKYFRRLAQEELLREVWERDAMLKVSK